MKIGCCRPGTGKFHLEGRCGEVGCAHYFLLPLGARGIDIGAAESLSWVQARPLKSLWDLNTSPAADLWASCLCGVARKLLLVEKALFRGVLG